MPIDNTKLRPLGGVLHPPGGSPVLVDLNGDGFLMTPARDGVVFDIAGNGRPIRISWTAGMADDAWLALDRNGNRRIDDGTELFGHFTPQPSNVDVRNGFEALRVYDQPSSGGNADGWIDARDVVYTKLLLWQDTNHNGISEPAELATLLQFGVAAISLDYKESRWVDAYGNQFRFRSKIDRTRPGDGNDKWAYDVFLVEDSPR